MMALLPRLLALTALVAGPAAAQTVFQSVIRQDCTGFPGPEPCYVSLADWEAEYGGIDFSGHAPGDLVAVDMAAVARIEGTWTAPDTRPLDLGGWNTDATHYIRIYTEPAARHRGTAGSGYRLSTTGARPLYCSAAHVRIEGLEIHGDAYAGHLVYLSPNTTPGVGEIHLSANLIHGDGVSTGSGILNYTCQGTVKIWNNIVYGVGTPGYTAGIQNAAGAAYIYNNTVVDIIDGFAVRGDGAETVAVNNLTDAPGQDFYGVFYPGSDFNASGDDTAPGFHSLLNQTFAFVDRTGGDYHVDPADTAAVNHGLDLTGDPNVSVQADIDGEPRAGAWDIGADEQAAALDGLPPVRFDGTPTGALPSDTTDVELRLRTTEPAACRFALSPGVLYADMTETFQSATSLAHTRAVTGLTDDTTYTYFVRCLDSIGNANPDDFVISYYVKSADRVPPVISNVAAACLNAYTAVITWNTDEIATSQVEYGPAATYGEFTLLDLDRVIDHAVTLRGLDPATTYHYRVRSRDVAGNEAVSSDTTFTTPDLGGPIYYVNQNHPQADDGNPGTDALPWATIQHGADVAQPGDTIMVYPGDYGRIRIRTGGTAGAPITFRGLAAPDRSLVDPASRFDPANPVVVPGNPAFNAMTRGFDLIPPTGNPTPVSYVRIENFEITRIYEVGVATGSGGIRLDGTAHVDIVGNFLHDLNPQVNDHSGIRADSHDNANVLVKGNTLYRVQGIGICILGQDWIVENNEVSHGLDATTDTGLIVVGDCDGVRFFGSGHVIRNNYLHDFLDEEQAGVPHPDAFQTFSVYPAVQFAHDILVEGNTCVNLGQGLMVSDSSEDNGTGNAVYNLTFRNNVFRSMRAVTIVGSGADHFTFVNNVVADSYYAGFALGRSPYLTVFNNIFFNNGSGSQIGDNASKVGTVWDFNLHYPDFSNPAKQPGYDGNSLFGADPLFVDAASTDFRLSAGSPAIDRGREAPDFNYDKAQTLRPQGAAWDMGAFENVGTRPLLRNCEITSLGPVTPRLALILPLDSAPQPAGDLYLPDFTSGATDPDATVLTDPSRPLVFYAVDAGVKVFLTRAAGDLVRITF